MTTNLITLYIATHNKTNLKYFGKTKKYNTEKSLQEKYHGSGIEWKEHLKEYGDDVTMEIYGIFHPNEVQNKALTFSLINDIVKSDLWANMKPEDGLDGGNVGGSYGMKGKTHSQETKDKIAESNRNKIVSKESRKKMSDAKKGKPSGRLGKTVSAEGRKNISESQKGKKLSKETIAKIVAKTKGLKRTDKTKKKISEAQKGKTMSEEAKNKIREAALNRDIKKCPHCGKEASPGMAKRWHFDSCKLKP